MAEAFVCLVPDNAHNSPNATTPAAISLNSAPQLGQSPPTQITFTVDAKIAFFTDDQIESEQTGTTMFALGP
ncbi:hypothetical protein MES5069_60001 [Mesorhizobium escarrei]|uniref:Uncharacterized protein n=1 Tax=Mesorhizobium escarrei TaxID=666018 RepID=A0ABN8KCL2_9HYPH|nr:hypothetical protein MES5069_60001 [Mesorhizobium escarrei]